MQAESPRPLRTLRIRDILRGAMRLFHDNFRTFIGIAAVACLLHSILLVFFVILVLILVALLFTLSPIMDMAGSRVTVIAVKFVAVVVSVVLLVRIISSWAADMHVVMLEQACQGSAPRMNMKRKEQCRGTDGPGQYRW